MVLCDASFPSNANFSVQLGYVVFLWDETDCANSIHFTSYKSKGVVHSILRGDLYTFADVYDYAFLLRHDLAKLVRHRLPVVLFTDYMSLFSILIHTNTVSTEKMLMIDIVILPQAFETRDITYIGCIRSSTNIADGLTNPAV